MWVTLASGISYSPEMRIPGNPENLEVPVVYPVAAVLS